MAPLLNIGDGAKRVNIGLGGAVLTFFHNVATTHRVVGAAAQLVAALVESHKSDSIGVERQKFAVAPHNLGGSQGLQHIDDGFIGHVALAGGAERAEEVHLVGGSTAKELAEEQGSLARSHSVTARGSDAYFVDISNG